MVKFSIAFCVLLVASVAHADDSSEGQPRNSETDIKNACSHSISNLFTKVSYMYEKVMAASPMKESIDVAKTWYDIAARDLYALYKEASDPVFKMPVEDNAMECSNDIAHRAYDAFHLSWNALDELLVMVTTQRELIEKERIERERSKGLSH